MTIIVRNNSGGNWSYCGRRTNDARFCAAAGKLQADNLARVQARAVGYQGAVPVTNYGVTAGKRGFRVQLPECGGEAAQPDVASLLLVARRCRKALREKPKPSVMSIGARANALENADGSIQAFPIPAQMARQ